MCVTVQLTAAKHRTAACVNIIPLLPHCFCVVCLMLATVLLYFIWRRVLILTACECLWQHSLGRDVIEWRTEIWWRNTTINCVARGYVAYGVSVITGRHGMWAMACFLLHFYFSLKFFLLFNISVPTLFTTIHSFYTHCHPFWCVFNSLRPSVCEQIFKKCFLSSLPVYCEDIWHRVDGPRSEQASGCRPAP